MSRYWIALVVLAVLPVLGGCIEPVVGPGFVGSDGVFANESDYTLTYTADWIPPHGTNGYEPRYEVTLNAHNEFDTVSLSEGRYRIRARRTSIGDIVLDTKITIPAPGGDRDFLYEEVSGHASSEYHWGVVATSDDHGRLHFRIGS